MRDTGIAYEAVTGLAFDEAVTRCRSELAREGFGVLTELDIQAKLKATNDEKKITHHAPTLAQVEAWIKEAAELAAPQPASQ